MGFADFCAVSRDVDGTRAACAGVVRLGAREVSVTGVARVAPSMRCTWSYASCSSVSRALSVSIWVASRVRTPIRSCSIGTRIACDHVQPIVTTATTYSMSMGRT